MRGRRSGKPTRDWSSGCSPNGCLLEEVHDRVEAGPRNSARRLRAHDLGALTGVGISSVSVYKKPCVALISTGDEIVDADTDPRPGQVRNINQHSLAGLIEECGGVLLRRRPNG